MRMKIDGVILRKDLQGRCQVLIQSGKSEILIIKDGHDIIDHWVNWSTVEDLLIEHATKGRDNEP